MDLKSASLNRLFFTFLCIALLYVQPYFASPNTDQTNEAFKKVYKSNNKTTDYGPCSCWNYNNLDILEQECHCSGVKLIEVPKNLIPNLQRLTLSNSPMKILKNDSLTPYKSTLKYFNIINLYQLKIIEVGVFHDFPELMSLSINKAAVLRSIDDNVFKFYLPKLKTLSIDYSGLQTIPCLDNLTSGAAMEEINLDSNKFEVLKANSLKVNTAKLSLNNNFLTEIEANAFETSQIAKLSIAGNTDLTKISPNAFYGIRSLRYLDLSRSSITCLPTNGLNNLEILVLAQTYSMKIFPSIYKFSSIKEAYLTYSYHCCAFSFPARHDPLEFQVHQELQRKYCPTNDDVKAKPNLDLNTFERYRRSWGSIAVSNSSHEPNDGFIHGNDEEFHHHVSIPEEKISIYCGNVSKNYNEVLCYPQPDAFNPCEDVMGNWGLRISVWVVSIAALLGNMAVLLVLLSSRFRMTVPKFLMCNLSAADFCMGIYLLMLAFIDISSKGDYFNYAIDWQNGLGCKIAGFLTIFASELSVFTLTVITSERWYTITYAIHLNKRLKLFTAAKIMAVGWLYAAIMGALPLFGISDYMKTSLCLPLRKEQLSDFIYLGVILVFNGLAFWAICICYGRMYFSIRQGQDAIATLARSDMRVAKRMALLVFTDFACWAPIVFFALTAYAGYPLINISKTKILIVFFYPLNSCANPYLYALLTQQYRRDMFILLSKYGLCVQRAAKYKGMTGATRGFPQGNFTKGNVNPGPTQPQTEHRGSVLTSLTSVENVAIRTIPLSTVLEASNVEMVNTNVMNSVPKMTENSNKISSYL